MIVHVTREDIAGGSHVCNTCPVALALNRATGRVWYVVPSCAREATKDGQIIVGGGRIEFPVEVYTWIRMYDYEKTGKPFSFEFDWEDKHDARRTE